MNALLRQCYKKSQFERYSLKKHEKTYHSFLQKY